MKTNRWSIVFGSVLCAVGTLCAADAYIQGTGTQAILTDCCPGANSRVEVDFAFDELEGGMRAIGVETYSAGNAFQFLVNGDGSLRYGIGNTWTGYYPGLQADTARHVAVLDAKGGTLSYRTGGETVWTCGITNATTRTGAWPLAIFGANKAAASLVSYQPSGSFAKMKLYSLKVYENNAIVHYYKPWKSTDGAFVGLKDLCTGKFFINGTNNRTPFIGGGDISDAPAWDLDETQPTITPETLPTSGDYVINVSAGQTLFRDGIDTDLRVVLTGNGTLVLGNNNRFGGGVVVSNGYLAADWTASGLSATHLDLVGKNNANLAIFRPIGSSFTAPVAASGAGTIQFRAFCGLGPWDHDLTVNLGDDARVLKKGVDGFLNTGNTEFCLGLSYKYTLTFANTIDMNNYNFCLKNPNSSMPTYITGCVTNSAGAAGNYGSSAAGNVQYGDFTYWDGTTVFVGQPGRNAFFFRKKSKFIPYCGTIVFSNCYVRVHNDTLFGNDVDSPYQLTIKYTGTTDHYADNAWDTFSQRHAESAIVVDGPDASYKQYYDLFLGSNAANSEKWKTSGHVVITNGGTVKVGTMCIHSGWVKQSSGLFEIPTNYGDGDAIRIGGYRASSKPVANGRGSAAYYLSGGRCYLSTRSDLHIGSAETGLFEQTGGTLDTRREAYVGYHLTGSGTYNLHGGIYTNGATGFANAMHVGSYGTGVVSVAKGGSFLAANSIQIGQCTGGVGRVALEAGGAMTVDRVQGGNGTGTFVFNGGTLHAAGTTYASGFLDSSLTRAAVGANGGTFDTAGSGSFTFAKPLLAATTNESCETLLYRWSFRNGSLVDSVSGRTATTVGTVTCTDGAAALAGGTTGSSQVELGTDLLPTDDRGCTIEAWFTLKGFQRFARLLQCGLTQDERMFFVSANRGSTTAPWYLSFAAQENRNASYNLQENKPYHLGFTMRKLPNGIWQGQATFRDAVTGTVLSTLVVNAPSGWAPTKLRQSDGLWLGNGAWGDPDPNAVYREVRIHSRVLSEDELTASVQAGARRIFGFTKAGAGTLTLTGVNSYTCGTVVEAGTLALAGGASLPATDAAVAAGATLDLNGAAQTFTQLSGAGTVKDGTVTVNGKVLPGGADTIGTLTLDGATLSATRLEVDVATNGACDRIVGALNVTGMTLAVANPEDLNPEISYRVVQGVATGTFASLDLPRRWTASVTEYGVRITYGGGSVIIIR